MDGAYCAACGQRNASIQRPLHHLGREVLSDYLGFDGKLWRTVVPLLTRPGFLTREYIEGRRNYYVRPVRLYLTASVALFFLLSVLPEGGFLSSAVQVSVDDSVADSLELNAGELGDIEERIAALDSARASLVMERDSLRGVPVSGAVATAGREIAGADSSTGSGFWDRFGEAMGRKGGKLGEMGEAGVKEWLVEIFTTNMPNAMFVLLPLFALFLKLLYARHKRYYGEHLVFALHTHAFVFFVFTLLALFLAVTGSVNDQAGWSRVLVGGTVLVLLLSVPAYIFLALKQVYAQGWGKTTLKWAVLMSAYNFALLTGIAVVVVVGFLML